MGELRELEFEKLPSLGRRCRRTARCTPWRPTLPGAAAAQVSRNHFILIRKVKDGMRELTIREVKHTLLGQWQPVAQGQHAHAGGAQAQLERVQGPAGPPRPSALPAAAFPKTKASHLKGQDMGVGQPARAPPVRLRRCRQMKLQDVMAGWPDYMQAKVREQLQPRPRLPAKEDEVWKPKPNERMIQYDARQHRFDESKLHETLSEAACMLEASLHGEQRLRDEHQPAPRPDRQTACGTGSGLVVRRAARRRSSPHTTSSCSGCRGRSRPTSTSSAAGACSTSSASPTRRARARRTATPSWKLRERGEDDQMRAAPGPSLRRRLRRHDSTCARCARRCRPAHARVHARAGARLLRWDRRLHPRAGDSGRRGGRGPLFARGECAASGARGAKLVETGGSSWRARRGRARRSTTTPTWRRAGEGAGAVAAGGAIGRGRAGRAREGKRAQKEGGAEACHSPRRRRARRPRGRGGGARRWTARASRSVRLKTTSRVEDPQTGEWA